MEQSEGVRPNPSLEEQSEVEDDYDHNGYDYDFDYDYRQHRESDDEDDMDDEEFCSTFLKSRYNEIIDGINLKDLCEGKEVMFQMNDTHFENDEEKYYKQEDDVDDDDNEDEEVEEKEEEEMINENFQKINIQRHDEKQPVFYLNESFDTLASKMTSITADDGVKKQVIVGGIGKVVPDECFVVVHYNLFKETSEEPFDSTYLRNRPERINLGQNDLILGLEIAIRTMKKRENSRFFISWNYAFGALGCPDRIEPKCNIIADVTLLNFKEIDLPGLVNDSASQFQRGIVQVKLEQAAANDSFEDGKIKQAIARYKSSVRTLNNLGFANARDERTALDLKVKSLVNLAICYNKLSRYELACVMCQEALSISPRNLKAQFHYARASIALSNFPKAQSLLLNLNKMSPNNPEIIEELRKLDRKKQLYTMTTREFWSKAFISLSEEEEANGQSTEESRPNGGLLLTLGVMDVTAGDIFRRLRSYCTQPCFYEGSNSPGKNSKGDCKDGIKDETKDGKKEEEEISRKFEQKMSLNVDMEAED